MKPIQTVFKFIAVLALVVLAAGCASNGNNLLDRENVAVAAGFKVITPTKPEQLARLQKLPVDKVTQVIVAGKTYYILPDLKNNRAYVGGPKQYRIYQQDRRIQQQNSENAGSPPLNVQVVEVNDMGWGEWDGWGAPGGMGGPDWY